MYIDSTRQRADVSRALCSTWVWGRRRDSETTPNSTYVKGIAIVIDEKDVGGLSERAGGNGRSVTGLGSVVTQADRD
jgi:hypothetical protein